VPKTIRYQIKAVCFQQDRHQETLERSRPQLPLQRAVFDGFPDVVAG
jgi:hypothetical protein